jgi:hypothetical protein
VARVVDRERPEAGRLDRGAAALGHAACLARAAEHVGLFAGVEAALDEVVAQRRGDRDASAAESGLPHPARRHAEPVG